MAHAKMNALKHGESTGGYRTAELAAYSGMLNRCLNSGSPKFKWYGAAGVKICDRWLGTDGFKNFLADMGRRPKGKTSLGRLLDVPLYSKETCVWQNRAEQGAERRGAHAAAQLHWHHHLLTQNLAKIAKRKAA